MSSDYQGFNITNPGDGTVTKLDMIECITRTQGSRDEVQRNGHIAMAPENNYTKRLELIFN
jgi:hypothetical protein